MTTIDAARFERRATVGPHHALTIVLSCAALTGVAIALAFMTEGINEYGWRAAEQYAERTAALLFLIPFLAGPLASLFGIWSLLIDRRAYGVGFAIALVGYIATVVGPFVFRGETVPPPIVAYEVAAFALLLPQLLTSNNLAVRVLGFSAWSRLHTFAMYGYWTLFTMTFFDRVVGPSRYDPVLPILLLLMIAALVARFAASFAVKVGLAEKVVILSYPPIRRARSLAAWTRDKSRTAS